MLGEEAESSGLLASAERLRAAWSRRVQKELDKLVPHLVGR